jgi:hypothetical protein
MSDNQSILNILGLKPIFYWISRNQFPSRYYQCQISIDRRVKCTSATYENSSVIVPETVENDEKWISDKLSLKVNIV